MIERVVARAAGDEPDRMALPTRTEFASLNHGFRAPIAAEWASLCTTASRKAAGLFSTVAGQRRVTTVKCGE
jgi:hypothetical protein